MPRRKTTTEENTTKTPEELQPKKKIGRPRKTKEEPKKTDEEPTKIPDPDPESYKTDNRVIDLHKAYTKKDVDRMVEDGELPITKPHMWKVSTRQIWTGFVKTSIRKTSRHHQNISSTLRI